jgi:tripartite-type tricarboxylate transporter receptor subunit TctC
MAAITRRTLTTGLLTLPFADAAFAQTAPWPVPQITVVVPFPPGGSTDALGRLIQPGLQQRLGATVIVENKAGASGAIGAAQVAKGRADGSQLLVTFDSHAVNPALQPLTFDTEADLEPVMLVGTAPYVVAAHPSRPYKTFADVVAAAKAAPGKVTYASVGSGTLSHLAMTLLGKRAGIELSHVPYRGGGPAVNDAVAGHVDLICGSVALLTQQIAGGALKPIMQTGKARVAALKDTQTAVESGFSGFECLAWWGVFAPKATPKPLVQRVHQALTETLKDATVDKVLREAQQMTVLLEGPEAMRSFLAREIKTWGDVVKDNNIKAG